MEPLRRTTPRVLMLAMFLSGSTIVSAQNAPVNPVHAHIGHVMTSWKDTPGMKGLLPTAIEDADVVVEQMGRADEEGRINDFVLYGGYVLNALDPGVETDALLKTAYARLPTTYLKIEVPGSGFGVKRAVAGALQHVQLAAKSDAASDNVKTHATHVTASLSNVAKWTDEAIAITRKLLVAKDVGDGQPLVDELVGLAGQIATGHDANNDAQIGWQTGEGGLRQAHSHMRLMMKGEGF